MVKAEILAPVGNYQMLEAGLAAGADSFYMAVDDFGARAYAENFDIDQVKDYIDLIHLFGKKVFVTMNILIKDEEIAKAVSYAQKLYEYGVDALIIQDLGLFTILKDKLRGLDLHASTQMAVRDYYGAKALMNLGFARVVIARETPIEELRKIANLPVEKEVFVHGSLCVSYSGECLMSSYFGARSANRGRCAGICRQKYQLESAGKTLAKDYFLNMKDLNVIDKLDDLIGLGINCFKIEGRMKTPEYVFNVVKNYKEKVDGKSYKQTDLRDISNRGYTKGFIFGQNRDYITLEKDNKHRSVGKVEKNGRERFFISTSDLVLGDNLEITTDKNKKLPLTTTKAYKKNDRIILEKYKDAKVGSDVLMLNSPRLTKNLDYGLSTYKNLPISLEFRGVLGEKPSLTLSYKTFELRYELDKVLEEAKKITISPEDIRENLSKFGDEIYSPRKIDVDIEGNIFISKKDINDLRRGGVEKLKEEILKTYHRKAISIDLESPKNIVDTKRQINIELKTTAINPAKLRDFDNIYINSYDEKYKSFNLYLNLLAHEDYDIHKLISFIKEKNIKGVIFNNYRDLNFVEDFRKNGIKIRIGRYMNVFNSYTYKFYKTFAEMICSSVEETFSNINQNSKYFPVEALGYGRIELMNMRHCPFSAIKKCGLSGCESCKFSYGQMVNEGGSKLRILREDGISIIYPDKASKVDLDKFKAHVSILVSVFTDDDLDDFCKGKKIDNINYDRGVI
ncbi:U32 family peptidase [uncultured Anaerococcus sp.]|uniref:peptidase U32 family protein n=1 Tax=uncultured Anaerococcus sp. TaxID=293428 RepID=UPI00288ABA1D|nr:U32 family peptidase [uncultured Anaerococcus sp.]